MQLGDIDKKDKLGEIIGSKGDTYSIYEKPDKSLACDCPARKSWCRHIAEFTFKRETERALTQLEYRGFIKMQSEGAFENLVNWICRIRKESL